MTQQALFTKKQRGKSKKKEEKVQIAICKYLRDDYPNIIFTCDLASGMKLPIRIATKNKAMRSSRGLPDLFIAHVRWQDGTASNEVEYCGLFLEIKQESVRLKSGGIASSPHHTEQEAILKQLREQGYKAEFACGLEEAKKLIDEYLQ